MKKTDFLIISFIILSSIYTLKDLFKPGFYTSHDGIHQVVRLYYFDQLIKDGQIPPRYVGGLYNGFGYPLFSFSYHLPWIIAEPLLLLGVPIFETIKLTFLIGFILSGITMYIFQKNVLGRLAAFVGMIIYLYAPYRFLNIFVRAAIGDATAFIFPPLIFLSIYMIKKEARWNWKWIALGAASFAALLLSHAMVFLLFFISLMLYFIYNLVYFRNKIFLLVAFLFIILFGFAISSYYFIPSLIERKFTVFSNIMGPALVGNTYITLKNLLYSPWGYGTMRAVEAGMSFQIGIAQWFVFILSSVLLVVYLFKKKLAKQEKLMRSDTIFYLSLYILSVLIMLQMSQIFWDILKKILFIDFTWRVLLVTIFASSLMGGYSMVLIKKYRFIIAFFIIFLAFYANRNHTRINKMQDWTIDFYLELEKTTNTADEYTPRWAQKLMMEKKITQKVQFTDDKAEINVLQNKSNYLEAKVIAYERGLVKINTVYYPGWSVYIDGKKVKFNYESSGFMEFPLEKGTYKVEAKFGETPLRLFSDSISLISIGFLGIMIYKKRKI